MTNETTLGKIRGSFLPSVFRDCNCAGAILSIDWEKEKAEILDRYRALVQIDTTNPPGNETKAVEYLKKVLEAEGIQLKLWR